MIGQSQLMDPFRIQTQHKAQSRNASAKLMTNTLPSESNTDVVQALEDDLRSEKKEQTKSQLSQILGSAGTQRPDVILNTGLEVVGEFTQNNELLAKARRYGMVDQVPPPQSRVLGDFSRILGLTNEQPQENNGLARNSLLAMSISTLDNATSEAQRVIESQLTYDLSAASFGMASEEERGFKKATKRSKFADAAMLV